MGKLNRVNRRKSHWVAENRRNYELIRDRKLRDVHTNKVSRFHNYSRHVPVSRKWI